MMQVQRDEPVPEAARNGESLGHWVDDVAEHLGLDTTAANMYVLEYCCLYRNKIREVYYVFINV
jgi:hypothetical protein